MYYREDYWTFYNRLSIDLTEYHEFTRTMRYISVYMCTRRSAVLGQGLSIFIIFTLVYVSTKCMMYLPLLFNKYLFSLSQYMSI